MTKRTEALADAIEDKMCRSIEIEARDDEVFVKIGKMAGMDRVCTVAYDHGFVPVGMVKDGATRFQPRQSTDVMV